MILRSACPWHIHNSPLAAQGARFGGGKGGGGGGTTYQQQTTTIPPEVLARYNAVNARAEQAADQPFQEYTGQFVAPINPVQQQAISNIGDVTGAYGPYYGGATASTLAGAAAGAPYYGAAGQNIAQAQAGAAPYQQLATQYGLAGTQAVNPQALQTATYMSPYLQQVVQPTMAALYQQQQQQQSQLAGNLAMQGAFGGDRGAIQQANLAQQQGLAASQTLGNLYNQAYQQALAAAQQQQGVNLAAQQANRAALQQFAPQALGIGQQAFQQPLAAAQAQQGLGAGIIGAGANVGQALAGYGQGLTQTGLAANQALLAGGTLGQQTQQAINTALYNQFLQKQGYPFQVAQFLANIAEGTGALSGSTTTGTTTAPGSWLSDKRAKENIVEIGETHDGQPIYKFNYKGEPRKQIGLIAQDVEHHHPDAVGLAGGLKTVDYDKATKHAEVHHAAEGGLVPESMGGVVAPSFDRQAFARSGAVLPDYNLYDPLIQQILQQRVQTGLAGGSPYTIGGSRIPASAMQPSAQRQILRGSLPALPRPQSVNPVTEAAATIKGAGTIGEAGGKLYDWTKGKIAGTDTTPPSPANKTIEEQQITATGPGSTPSDWTAGSSTAVNEFPYMVYRGGRIHREDGGDVLPYGPESSGYVDVGSTKSPSQLQSEQKSMSAGLGGAGGGKGGSGGGGGLLGGLPGGLLGGIGSLKSLGDIGNMAGSAANWLATQAAIDQGLTAASAMIPAGMSAPEALALGLIALKHGGVAAVAHGGRIHRQEGGGVLSRARNAIGHIESSNNYKALGPMTGGDRAYGRYQVMGRNIPSWTEEALGRRMTSQEFLNSPEAQDRVFDYHFGKAMQHHGNIDDAASVWFSGRPLKQAGSSRDVLGTTVPAYIRRFHEAMGSEGTPVVSRGLAPVTDVVDLNERPKGLVAPKIEQEDENEYDRETAELWRQATRRASGGVAGRAHYQFGGADNTDSLTDKYLSDYFTPKTAEETAKQQAGVVPQNEQRPPTPPATAYASLPKVGGFDLYSDKLPPIEQYPRAGGVAPARTEPAVAGLAPPKHIGTAPIDRGYGVSPAVSTATPTAASPSTTVSANQKTVPADQKTERGFFGEVGDSLRGLGDWFGRNKEWLVPAASFVAGSAQAPTFALGLAPGAKAALGAYTGIRDIDIRQQQADIGSARELYKIRTETGAKLGELIASRAPAEQLSPLQKQYDALGQQINRLLSRYAANPEEMRSIISAIPAQKTVLGPTPVSVTPTTPPPTVPGTTAPSATTPPGDVPEWARPAGITPEQQQWVSQNIDPARNPDILRQQALEIAPYDSATAAQKRRDADAIQAQIIQTGQVPVIGGGFMPLPGYNSMQAQTQRTADNTQWKDKFEARQQGYVNTLATAAELEKALQEAQSGPLRGAINRVASIVQDVTGKQIPSTEADAFQIARKNAYKLVMDNLRASGAMSDDRYQGLLNATADLNLLPEANKAIMAELVATAKWAQDRDNWLNEQMAPNKYPWMDRAAAAQAWARMPGNDLSERIAATKKNIAVLGDIDTALTGPIGARRPDPAKLRVGQMYMVPTAGGYRRARFKGPTAEGGADWKEE